MNAKDRDKAISTLNGIITITEHEMLTHGTYVDEAVTNPKLKEEGAMCGGRTACLVGSAYIAYGVPGVAAADYNGFTRDRELVVNSHPALWLALRALDEEAEKRIFKDGDETDRDRCWEFKAIYEGRPSHVAEHYFEGFLNKYAREYSDARENCGNAARDTREKVIELCEAAIDNIWAKYIAEHPTKPATADVPTSTPAEIKKEVAV